MNNNPDRIFPNATEKAVLLTAINVTKTYQEGRLTTPVLNGVSFRMRPKEMLAIVGSSGSGKSTLLHLLAGLDTPTSGDILFLAKSMQHLSAKEKARMRNRDMGFIYQFHHLLPDFNALENIAMPLLIGGVFPKVARQRAQEMLSAVQLAPRARHRPAELSGGERQRVAIARALINRPKLVMADEPTGNLDAATAETIFSLLLHLNQEYGTAFLVVTHDLNLANQLDNQYEMRHGELCQLRVKV